MFYIIAFIFGSIWGSFSNVCIQRIPDNISVITGRSHCPQCKKKIKWYDNLPLISYIFLNAKCRNCDKSISARYFIVELITGISFSLIFLSFKSIYTIIFLSFLILILMEVIIHTPNFYLHLADALVFIQYCINGLIEFSSQIKL